MSIKKLINKKIIISAAADGIGWIIAQKCLTNGATVFISDNNTKALDKISKHDMFNKNLFFEKVNASNSEEVFSYFTSINNSTDHIDGLINNVGIAGPTGNIEDIEIEDWIETIETNVNSHFYYTKFAIPLLKKNKGASIINISSTAGLYGFPLRAPYSASKWAIIGMTKTLAMELGKFNIRVNAVCPGSVSGDRINRVIEAKAKKLGTTVSEIQKEFESHTSLQTFVSKEDIANIVIFLLSEDANKISGQSITIDGNTERMN